RNEEDDSIMKMKAAEEALEEKQKVKPSFELSGKLAAETNRVRGVTLLFNEPPEARKPDIKWRLYVFKTGEMLNAEFCVTSKSKLLLISSKSLISYPIAIGMGF
ncbi:FHA domain-containing protein ddl-like, partial [Trifolium pratense]